MSARNAGCPGVFSFYLFSPSVHEIFLQVLINRQRFIDTCDKTVQYCRKILFQIFFWREATVAIMIEHWIWNITCIVRLTFNLSNRVTDTLESSTILIYLIQVKGIYTQRSHWLNRKLIKRGTQRGHYC
jgi:hypothetical protein